MAIKNYKFDYDCYEAKASFKIDTDIFTSIIAKEILDFFDFEEDEDEPILSVLKQYALEVIRLVTHYSFNVKGVISDFKRKEGFVKLDGSMGITLIAVKGYEFDKDKLQFTIN